MRAKAAGLLLLAALGSSLLASELAAAPARAPETWGVVQPDLDQYFDRAEAEAWAASHARRRALGAAGLAAGLVFYLVMLGGPGRRLDAAAGRAASRLAALGPFRSGPARWLGRGLGRLFGEGWARSLLYLWGYLAAGLVVALPFLVAGEALDRAEGLSRQTAWSFAVDLVKAEALAWAALTVFGLGLFAVIRRLPRTFWLAVGLPVAALLPAWGALAPYQTRLFHEVRPLEAGPLRDRIEALAAAEGLPLTAVDVVEASRVTTTLDAYVTGEGPTRELVLYDTLLAAVGEEEVLVAVAHELEHERRRRPLVGHLLAGLGGIGLLGLIALALGLGAPRLGLDGPGDVRALPLVMLVVSLAFLAARPIELARSRAEERAADMAALVATGDPEAFVRLQVALARANRADLRPSTATVLLYGSHPPVGERIGMALWYERHLDRARGGGPPSR